jgi:CHAD domain-containing protein
MRSGKRTVRFQPKRGATPRIRLLYWAKRALAELRKAGAAFEADPVHKFRVAIRRCRSMAKGLQTIDPSPEWKQFRNLGRPLFSALGDLRDMQVMQEWLSHLASETDPARKTLAATLSNREHEQKRAAHSALKEFAAKRWLKLAVDLDARTARLLPGSRVFQHLALERWIEAYQLHETAMRTRRDADLHQLRIGIKRFRYTVENFLPNQHKRWSKDLKHMQDLLGEVHDLDVLRGEIATHSSPPASAEQLNSRIQIEREKRVKEYECRMTGPEALWNAWRQGLPSGRDLSLAVNAKMRYWYRALDPEPGHSHRVAQMSVDLWHSLRRELGWRFDRRAPVLLRVAALFHNIGADKRKKRRDSYRTKMVSRFSAPAGWSAEEMRVVRLVSHYGNGPLPAAADVEFASLTDFDRARVMKLAGIIRLADVLEQTGSAGRNVQLHMEANTLSISIPGFDPLTPPAIDIAAARHLLEVALGRPILVLGFPAPELRDSGPVAVSQADRPGLIQNV